MDKRPKQLARARQRHGVRLLSLALLALSVASVGYALTPRARQPALGTLAGCRSYRGLPVGFGTDPHAGMVQLRAGSFVQGSTAGYADERPTRARDVAAFWIDRTEVTNAQFLAFTQATGYLTTAEREGGAAVFHVPTEAELAGERYAFWRYVEGASFRHPEGPDSQIAGRESEPVVQVSFADASAYARWLGHELPSEAEWEYAARAGREDEALHRAPLDKQGRALANFWQGDFPLQNSRADGFVAQAPVGCFLANPFGLHDMIGNVWEWTSSQYTESHAVALDSAASTDCRVNESADPVASSRDARVIKGGSFLCSANFCARYRVSARHPQESSMPALHVGFRTVSR
ncbi:MAG: sulfatase-modifying factor 1 [Myxococcaceae bacterium]|nr:sulfatase-modifying factor 1 [Myxococcaceae bacterium]